MTEQEWKAEEHSIKTRIGQARAKAKGNLTLEAKLVLVRRAKELDEELRQHRLHYFDLIG